MLFHWRAFHWRESVSRSLCAVGARRCVPILLTRSTRCSRLCQRHSLSHPHLRTRHRTTGSSGESKLCCSVARHESSWCSSDFTTGITTPQCFGRLRASAFKASTSSRLQSAKTSSAARRRCPGEPRTLPSWSARNSGRIGAQPMILSQIQLQSARAAAPSASRGRRLTTRTTRRSTTSMHTLPGRRRVS